MRGFQPALILAIPMESKQHTFSNSGKKFVPEFPANGFILIFDRRNPFNR
jgi:hypothetical protein